MKANFMEINIKPMQKIERREWAIISYIRFLGATIAVAIDETDRTPITRGMR